MVKVVTGGNGLVGSQFGPAYVKLGRKDADFTRRDETIALFAKHAPHAVIHTAAKVGGLYSNLQSPADYFEQNLRINTNVLEACRLSEVKKMVAFLSTCIFPDVVEYPLTEEKIHLGPPHASNYGYAYAKRMLEVGLQTHNQQYGTRYFCVIPTNIYGTHDNFNLNDAHVIPALIHKVFIAREKRTALQIPGDGSALREFVFAPDVAAIVESLLEKYEQTAPLIVSSGVEISIKQVLEMIIELMNYKGKIEWQSQLTNGQHRKPSDIGKLKSVLPGLQFTGIYQGLKQTVEWFELNYGIVRK